MVMILIFIFEALIYLSYVIAHNTVYGLLKIIIWFSGPVFRLLFSIVTKYPSLALLLVTFWIHRKPVWIFLVQSWVSVKSLIRQPLSFTSTRLSKRVVPCLIWLWHLFVCLSFYPRFGQGRKVPKQIKLKLAVDKERNRVLFAESDKDFVDILFSFLTLPIGTIIRLAERRSGIGCMDYLYKSVEALDEQFLETKACKTMLLNPRSAYEVHCRNLALKIDGTEPAKHYTCSKMFCSTKAQKMEGFRLASMVKNSVCSCGRAMDKEVFLEYQENVTDGDGVFMKGTRRFTITDNLHITPISMSHSLAMFQKLRLESGNGIEALTVTVDEEEVLYLLKRSLVSKTPMTESFLSNEENTENAASSSRSNHHETRSQRPSHKFRKMKVKLLIDKSSRRVLCLEAKEDFVNLVLSFLTFPLGSIIKLLRGHSSLGCMDNLYRSVGSSKLEDCFKSTKCKEMLLSPKLPMDFSLNQSLPIREEDPATYRSYKCSDCFRKNMVCLYPWHEKLCFMNPKLPGQAVSGGGFIKKETLLLINDDLTIQPLSPINGILDLDKLRVLVSNSEEHEVEVGEEEALILLKAALISKSVLNHVFKPNDLE